MNVPSPAGLPEADETSGVLSRSLMASPPRRNRAVTAPLGFAVTMQEAYQNFLQTLSERKTVAGLFVVSEDAACSPESPAMRSFAVCRNDAAYSEVHRKNSRVSVGSVR
jgi:hypothetical protein